MPSKFQLTPDQQSVVDSRDQNILVSAAAGSGKTRVLTERIVGRICDAKNPIDIDRILVVTFTTSAAREMKDRISSALSAKLAENPGNSHLEKQATLIHNALITTIDSFCLYVVRNNFHKIDADPSFRIIDEGEKALIMQEVMDDVLSRAYASGDEDFHHIVDCYSKKDKDDSLEKSINSLFAYAMSYPWPGEWLKERKKDYETGTLEEFASSRLLKDVYENIKEGLTEAVRLADKALKICDTETGPVEYKDNILSEREMFEGFIKKIDENIGFDELRELFLSTGFATLRGGKKSSDETLRNRAKKLRDRYKEIFGDIPKKFLFDTLENLYSEMRKTAKTVNKLIDLTIDYADSFAAAKKDKGVIDFADMEHMAVEILIGDHDENGNYEISDVARDYRDYFEEVMVDEYQDSNLVQEIIIRSVSKENTEDAGNRFMVGDVKQSIYSFRMARPQIFAEKVKNYSKDPGAKNRLITLKNNYRSRGAVLNSVNAVFENIMTADRGGVDYDDDARLYIGGSFTPDVNENITEVILTKADAKAAKSRKLEAKAIALKVKEIVGNLKVTNGKTGELRPASYKDIAVLFRSPTKWTGFISEAFEEAGIPFHMEGVGDFYEATEVRDVLSFLEVLDNPLSDISLYAAMTSYFGGFKDEECAKIKADSEGYYFWERVNDHALKNPEDEKVRAFLSLIDRYREYVTYMPIDELLTALFDETGYRHIVAALPSGKQRLANINLLISKARGYAATSFYGLFHFLRYVELIRKTEQDEGEANVSDENADVLRVMSIHKSKGLEFPVCIIGGIGERFNDSDSRSAFMSNIDAGLGAYYIDPVKRIKKRTLKQSVVGAHIRKEAVGEEIRVLYVAMTRPKEKLILTGSVPDPEEWFDSGFSGKESSYADLIEESVTGSRNIFFKCTAFDEATLESAVISKEAEKAVLKSELETGLCSDAETEKKIRERFSYEYPKKYLSRLYMKTTVSKLKIAAMEEDYDSLMPFEETESAEYIPKFAKEAEEVKGTDRGTAYHNLLQLLNFGDFVKITGDADYREELKKQILRIEESGKMSPEAIEKVNSGKIVAFLKTDTAKDMGIAEETGLLYREQPFVIGMKASEIDAEFPETETILVQGVIDVYYIKDGSVTILDYKTDRVEEDSELVRRYKTQLDYYGAAIGRLTGKPVKEKLIYSFALNKIVGTD